MSQLTISTTTPVVSLVDGHAVTTSQEVARIFGKQHKDVLRAIENLAAQLPDADRVRNFAQTVETRANPSGGAPIESPAYRLTRDGFTLLAMGFTGKRALQFKLAYIAAFNRMEAELRQPQPDRLSEPAYRKEANAFALSYFDQCRALVPKGQKVPSFTHTVDPRIADGLVANTLMSGRWLLSFDHEYRMQMTPVARDACVMSLRELLKVMNEPNGMMVETELLAEFAAATIKRLAHRAEYRKEKK